MDEQIKPVAPAPIRITEQGLTGERFTRESALGLRDALNSIKPSGSPKYVAERALLAMWAATPSKLRDIRTQKEFAQMFGISETAVSLWKREPQFKELYDSALFARLRDELANLAETAIEQGKAGDLACIRFIFELYGGKLGGSQQGINVATQVNVNLSDPFAEEQVKQEELPTWASEGNAQ